MITTRPATLKDQNGLSALISYEYYVHRHLDWRSPLDWLGQKPFWLVEKNDRIQAALAFPTNPPEPAWVRIFAANATLGAQEAWELLFPRCLEEFAPTEESPLAALALQDWFTQLLTDHHFKHFQDIVVLSWDENEVPTRKALGERRWTLRPMKIADIPAVAELDQVSFERLWQISAATLERSFKQAGYSTVVEMDGRLIGYQISTTSAFSAHLARLAVHPEMQRQYLGYALVQDLQDHFLRRRIRYLTVNTQNNNRSSLALYQKMGFQLTGEKFPVYVYEKP
jgi:ribosomal protein S18 acetylase RimI-like enzyme